MDWLTELFGEGRDLNSLQMSLRAFVIFFVALILVRIAGRRSFGKHTTYDNIIVFLLGAILSRAVVGVSPFVPTVIACLVISIMHRIVAWLGVTNIWFENITKGKKFLLYENGALQKQNMKRSLASIEDIMEDVRLRALTNSLETVKEIYMERSGEISVVKKEKGC